MLCLFARRGAHARTRRSASDRARLCLLASAARRRRLSNDIDDVAALLRTHHADHFAVWNLTERAYDYSKLDRAGTLFSPLFCVLTCVCCARLVPGAARGRGRRVDSVRDFLTRFFRCALQCARQVGRTTTRRRWRCSCKSCWRSKSGSRRTTSTLRVRCSCALCLLIHLLTRSLPCPALSRVCVVRCSHTLVSGALSQLPVLWPRFAGFVDILFAPFLSLLLNLNKQTKTKQQNNKKTKKQQHKTLKFLLVVLTLLRFVPLSLAGKGRTGLVIACLLYYLGKCSTMDAALRCFAERRSKAAKGVRQLAQLRYASYFERALSAPIQPQSRRLRLVALTMRGAPAFEQYYSQASFWFLFFFFSGTDLLVLFLSMPVCYRLYTHFLLM